MTEPKNLVTPGDEGVLLAGYNHLLEGLLERLWTAGPRNLSDDEMLELFSELMARIEGTPSPAGSETLALLKSGQDRLDLATAQVLEKGEPDPLRRMLRVVRTELQARCYQRLVEGGLLQ